MAFYSLLDFYPGYPYSRNCSGIEIAAIRFISLPQKHTFGMYQSPNVSLRQMRQRLHPDWNTSTLVDNSERKRKRKKITFRFHPLESMVRVLTGWKLNTFARFAFQRYYIKGNLTNVYSFIDSFSSIKCKLYRNWLLRSFWPCEKAMCSLPLQKKCWWRKPLSSSCAIIQNSTKLRM